MKTNFFKSTNTNNTFVKWKLGWGWKNTVKPNIWWIISHRKREMGVGQKPELNVHDVQALVQSCIKTRNDSGVEILSTGTFLKTTVNDSCFSQNVPVHWTIQICLWTKDCDVVGMLVAREICICSEVPLMQKMKYAGFQATYIVIDSFQERSWQTVMSAVQTSHSLKAFGA